jgi:hypothetical protein
MYLEKQSSEIHVLRQGDILENVHILGAINLQGINYEIDTTGDKISFRIPSKPNFGYVIVLSHSCEIDPSNLTKLTSIILAPLRDVNKATSTEKMDELIISNLVDDSSTMSYLKYFYLEPTEFLPFPNGAIVDFSKCFSVRNKCYDVLLSKKILQMGKDFSNKMALKFALYIYREAPMLLK